MVILCFAFLGAVSLFAPAAAHDGAGANGEEVDDGVGASGEAVGTLIKTVLQPAIYYGKLWGKAYSGTQYRHYTIDNIVQTLTNRMCLQNAVAGGTTAFAAQFAAVSSLGLGAPAVLAGQISTSLATSITLQISLVAAVATARGFDENDPRFDQMVMWVIVGDTITESLKTSAGAMASKAFDKFIFSGIGGHTKAINEALMPILGQKFVTIAAKTASGKGLVNLASMVPFVGAAVSFVADGGSCMYAAQYLDFKIFEGAYRDKQALLVWLENDVKLAASDVQCLVDEDWDWVSICSMTTQDVKELSLKKGPKRKLVAGLKRLTHCTESRDEFAGRGA